jgi:hypothetical protein
MTNKTNPRMQPDVVTSVITHLPDLAEEYHSTRLDVIKACLLSMRAGSYGAPVMVWDNGSCHELTDWLRTEYEPDTLVLSKNVGKSNARAALVRMVKPEAIIAVSDDDMLFYPGWLDACVRLLQALPEVGKTSCYPVRTQSRWGCVETKAWARENAVVEVGKFISENDDYDFCTSIGREYDHHKEGTVDDFETRITLAGVTAYAGAHHCQFVAYAARISPFCVRSESYMHDEKPFDNAVDAAGYLQLTTTTRYARHIGNVIDQKAAKELIGLNVRIEDYVKILG